MEKKKGNKVFWCYFGLVILILLLILPIGLRLFGKDLYEKEIKSKDVVEVLNCNKDNATIDSTFLNGVPQNLSLRIKGDYSVKEEADDSTASKEETSDAKKDTVDDKVDGEEGLIKYIREYSIVEYSVQDDVTSFKTNMTDLKQLNEYIALFNNLENQQKYYVSQAFYCTVTTY